MQEPEIDERLPVPVSAGPLQVLEASCAALREGRRGAMATVLARHGSAPSTPGQKLFLAADGHAVGTVGGGAVERQVLLALQEMTTAAEPRHTLRSFKLGAELGMCCGGQVEVFLEPLNGKVPVLVVGAGHVGSALAPLLHDLGFHVTVCDVREAYAGEGRLGALTVELGEFDEVGARVDPRGACLTMTHDHALDQRVVEWAMARGFAFVGGVGSRAKAERTRQRLAHKGFDEATRARLRMPLGLPIGARLPAEIAVSIAAELLAWRNQA